MSKKFGVGLAVVCAAFSSFSFSQTERGAALDFQNRKIDFRVYSENATCIDLLLFSAGDTQPFLTRSMSKNSSHVWAAEASEQDLEDAGWKELSVSELTRRPLQYQYRASGPNAALDVDAQGNRFNPNKGLFDPYSYQLSQDPLHANQTDESIYRTGPADRVKNSVGLAPRTVVIPEFPVPKVAGPTRPFRDEVIYELHVRGMTASAPHISADKQGTFSGLVEMIPYLKQLGVTAVELMPVFEFQDEANSSSSTVATNYWGYDPLTFFGLNSRFATEASRRTPGGALREFAAMIDEFHRHGLKVYLDVVYNHTAEGGAGPTGKESTLYSWRGLDNSTYYQIGSDPCRFQDNTGCGANFNVAHPEAREQVLNSLKFFRSLNVDGFRLDLASVVGNTSAKGNHFHFDKMAPQGLPNRILKELPARPDNGGEGIDAIAEPWGLGPGTYQVGQFPYHPKEQRGWGQWNDVFRRTLRSAENKWGISSPTPGDMASALSGSAPVFQPNKQGPGQSINYVVSHDGFTLRDLVTYNVKNNSQPFPYGPTDGGDDHNLSWDHVTQGLTAQEIEAQREKAMRNFMTLLLVARGGVPMFQAGDELGKTLLGNNNPYRIDAPSNWFPWKNLGGKSVTYPFFHVVRKLIAFRKQHPSLRPSQYADGLDHNANGLRDLSWYQANGRSAEDRDLEPGEPSYMSDAWKGFLAFRVDASEAGETDRSLFVAYNWNPNSTELRLPNPAPGKRWYWFGDTSEQYAPIGNFVEPGNEKLVANHGSYKMAGRSLAIFVER